MFRDAIGHMFRCGRDVFVRNAFEWKVGGRWHYGEAPARLQRLFHFDDDDEEEGEKRLMVEHNWCWNFEMLSTVPGFDDVIPEDLLIRLRADECAYLEGDLSACDEFEAITSDASVYRVGEDIPEADAHAFTRLGTVRFELKGTEGNDATVVESITEA